MCIAILTREFPPDVYGGAGVHVEYLVRELRKLVDVDVHCFGGAARRAPRRTRPDPRWPAPTPRCRRSSVDLSMAAAVGGVRRASTRTPGTPTWPGTSAKLLHGIPHVVTAHSLEPQRPWKAEQLGGGYRRVVLGRADGLRGGRRGRSR